jgi:son of sevenless-like protein
MIKGATLAKLVERLTYHVYADPMFMKTFLTTYRSFSNPPEFLELLIQRFNIPDPEFSSDSESDSDVVKKASKMRIALDMKRFRKEYSAPVQFRVINVLKHWVDQHFYDFQRDSDLLNKLDEFLEQIPGMSRNMKKWVEVIKNNIERKRSNEENSKDIIFNFDKSSPPIETHLETNNPKEEWPELLTYHPIEFARQLTLLDFQYYRAVKPSELVDLAWMGKEKNERSRNLLICSRHTTNVTNYLEKLIVETESMEERIAVMNRIIEIMVVLQEQNNFNGMLAISACMQSASIHRLTGTKEGIRRELKSAIEESSSLVNEHHKLYWKRLREINPPCVPFFGTHLNNIFFLEEGNPDVLPCCQKSGQSKGMSNNNENGKKCCDNRCIEADCMQAEMASIPLKLFCSCNTTIISIILFITAIRSSILSVSTISFSR